MHTRLAIVLTALAVWLFAAPTAGAARSEFFGIVQGPRLDTQDLQGLRSARIRTARFLMLWREVHPTQRSYRRWVTNDLIVGGLASHGIRPAPFVFGSPQWVNPYIGRPPASAAHEQAWRDFLSAAVARYGPGGSYWAPGGKYKQVFGQSATPLPVQSWQIWSEPNLNGFDPGGTVAHAAAKYARLVEISHDAIESRDPNARIVLAGMAACCGNIPASQFLANLYQVPGVESDFDVAAMQPYARNMNELRRQIVEFRAVMTNNADGGTPLWFTEFAWGSGSPEPSGHNVGLAGQRNLLEQSYELFLQRRIEWNLQRVFWFFWRDPPAGSAYAQLCPICGTAGLLRDDRTAKPAYPTFRSFTAETTPPVASITAGPGQGSFTNDPTPTFTFASNEAGTTFICRFDASYFTFCSSPYTRATPLTNGNHSFSIKAIDAPGNESAVVSRSFVVDTVPPQTTITSGPSGLTTDDTPTFTFVSNQPGSTFACRFNSKPFAPCSGPGASHTPATPLFPGSHSFDVRATDRAQNADPTPSRRTFTVIG